MSSAKGRRTVYERSVEGYQKQRVEECGGRCDLLAPRGTKGLPDTLVTWRRAGWAQMHLIEVKTDGGALEQAQIDDHKARAKLGCTVRVHWSRDQVEAYVREYATDYVPPKPERQSRPRRQLTKIPKLVVSEFDGGSYDVSPSEDGSSWI